MPSINRPSPIELTRLEAVARRLNDAWSDFTAVEVLRNTFAESGFKEPGQIGRAHV